MKRVVELPQPSQVTPSPKKRKQIHARTKKFVVAISVANQRTFSFGLGVAKKIGYINGVLVYTTRQKKS